ncbi:MAG: geranyl transferase [Gammaproteobacteria bacterium]|nr:MAG: geranyl transferase [Gammaproteobacteria bacterium]TDJ42122.1 MAG: geranyl transferase [Gammaproteobacteria bacterium]
MPGLSEMQTAIDSALNDHLPGSSELAPRLVEAMRYAVLGSGKHIRPLLTCATATSLGASLDHALTPGCAVEFLHAYSLIHDDLPSMDDDDLRRGRPSCHRAFDEATAILAGDALQALAFECVIGAPGLSAETRIEMAGALARSVGHAGMVGGQALDIAATGANLELDQLRSMHAAKTGALISVSVRLGVLIAGEAAVPGLDAFGEHLGLAFQVVDDLLDVTGSTESLGKAAGADRVRGKSTFPALVGLEGARHTIKALHADALSSLAEAGIHSGPLVDIAAWIIARET